jgi:putative transposase
MPRKRREDYPGAWHHVMNRGARRAAIFKVESDCSRFLEILGEVARQHQLEVHSYSLMPNHYHLLVRTPLGNLSRCMQKLNGSFTLWLNKVHDWDGPVFRGRFKSQLVDTEDYLRYLVAYIHLNPIEARLVSRLDSPAWTSHRAYVEREPAPDWLSVSQFLELLGGPGGVDSFVRSVRRKALAYPDDFDPETGLFGKKAIGPEKCTPAISDRESPCAAEEKAIVDMLGRVCRLTGEAAEMLTRKQMGPGANPARRFAAWALRRGADLTYRQIADALDMPYSQVAKLLSRIRSGGTKPPLSDWIERWVAEE